VFIEVKNTEKVTQMQAWADQKIGLILLLIFFKIKE
jgi:hypothetical protein